jgi:hypothetical protein
MTRNAPARLTANDRHTALRRFACSFPLGGEGVRIDISKNAREQLVEYALARVQGFGHLSADAFRELAEQTVDKAIEDGHIRLSRHKDRWHITDEFQKTQHTQSARIKASRQQTNKAKERAAEHARRRHEPRLNPSTA